MSEAITSTKLEQTGNYFGTANAVCVHGYLRFETGTHASEMRGYLVYVLIVKKKTYVNDFV